MAPLYNRYIPPRVKPASASERQQQPVPPQVQPQSSSTVSKKRKRASLSTSQGASTSPSAERGPRLQHDASDVPIDSVLEDERTVYRPSREFAHVRSAKKRHKLEKEARKARKLADRERRTAADDQQDVARPEERAEANQHSDEPSRALTPPAAAADGDLQHGEADSKTGKPKARKPRSQDLEELERDAEDQGTHEDNAHLKKHRRVLSKFERSQRLRRKTEQSAVSPVEDSRTESEQAIRPLEPFNIQLDDADTSLVDSSSYSNLPAWLAEPIFVDDSTSVPFSDLHLPDPVLQRLESLGFQNAFPVQQAIIPSLLPPGSSGSRYLPGTESVIPDVAISAPTGSGKTLAYLLPMIEALQSSASIERQIQVLIVLPTRELVSQTASLAAALTEGSNIMVGTASTATNFKDEQQRLVSRRQMYDPKGYQHASDLVQMIHFPPGADTPAFGEWLARVDSITLEDMQELKADAGGLPDHTWHTSSAVDILVCTPGRLVDHIKNTAGFTLAKITWLVIDEADKLLDEQYGDFMTQLQDELSRPRRTIEQDLQERYNRDGLHLDATPRERRVRKVVLSATMTRDVSRLAALKLQRPQLFVLQHKHGSKHQTPSEVEISHRDSDRVDGEQYQLPQTLQEFYVPAGDGNEKPLHLFHLLKSRILGISVTDSRDVLQSDLMDDEDARSTLSRASGATSDNVSDSSSGSDVSSESDSEGASIGSSDTDAVLLDSEQREKLYNQQKNNPPHAPSVLIFTSSNESAARLSHLLKGLMPSCASNIMTLTKNIAGTGFKAQSNDSKPFIVIATDRGGRGLDTLGGRQITHVVQYDVPRSVVAYVHRVGRTARAGRPGQAWTLYTRSEARWFIKELMKTAKIKRSFQAEKVSFKIDDDALRRRYEDILAEMRESVAANSGGL